jgi:type IV/VI secretion system ImpK/VasF family protein
MSLLEIYEELFQYICRLNRAAKTDAHPEFARVRAEVKTMLDEITRNASGDVRVLNQVKRLELPVIFFVDNLICTSRLKFAAQWDENRLAKEKNELAGDERFFDFLDQDLSDTSEEAAERLSIYYACLGLGFMGMYQMQPEQIRTYIDRIFPRIRQWIDVDPRGKVTEDAYRCTDTRMLTEPPSRRIIFVAVLFVFLALTVLSVIYGLYVGAAHDLTVSIGQILKAAASTPGQ